MKKRDLPGQVARLSDANDFLGLMTLVRIKRIKELAESLDLDSVAVQFFTIGWKAKESGKWKDLRTAIAVARKMGLTILRKLGAKKAVVP